MPTLKYSGSIAVADQITEQQRRLWDAFAPGWEKWDEFAMRWLSPISDELLAAAQIGEDNVILDVSTGTGEPGLTAALRVPRGRVVGTDVSEGMVNIANAKAKLRGIINFEARVADAEHLPFDDSSFDAVLCRLGVMFFSNPPAGVQEMVRTLKAGGTLALAAWAEHDKNPWGPTIARTIHGLLGQPPPPSPDAPGPFRHGSPGALQRLVELADLKDIKETEVKGELAFDSPDHYWEFMTDVAAPIATALKNADDDMRQAAKEATVVATQPYRRGSTIVFEWNCRVVSGTKR